MALLSKLKSLLGFGGGADDRQADTTVTVEHDPEDAVDEPAADTATAEPAADSTAADEDEQAQGDDADAVDEIDASNAAADAAAADPEDIDEPAEAAESDDQSAEADEAIDAVEADTAEPAESAAADDGDSGEPLDSIKGIGPAYSERLTEAGIDSVAELAEGDAEEIGEAISVSPKTVSNWIDRAAER